MIFWGVRRFKSNYEDGFVASRQTTKRVRSFKANYQGGFVVSRQTTKGGS